MTTQNMNVGIMILTCCVNPDSPKFPISAGKYLLCAGETKTLEIKQNATVYLYTRFVLMNLHVRTSEF